MSWVRISRNRFNLDLVRHVEDFGDPDSPDESTYGVCITLDSGGRFQILGPNSQVFLAEFDQHVASRSIERPPPGERAPGVVLPEPPSRRRPAQPPGVEEVGLVRVDAPGNLNEA